MWFKCALDETCKNQKWNWSCFCK